MKILVFIVLLFPFCVSAQLADDFYNELVKSNIYQPIGIQFDSEGFGYVWLKSGKVMLLDTNGVMRTEPIVDISEEVVEWADQGMLGFSVDPNFHENHYVYMSYVVDRHHLLYYGTDQYHPDSSIAKQATIGRLTRYTLDEETREFIPSTRKILLGKDKNSGIPILCNFHGIGAIQFGDDGSLLLTAGDSGHDIEGSGPNYIEQALEDGIISQKEAIGPYRAQLVDNFNGKILRINPEDGSAYPSNPFYDEENPSSPRSYVFALGIRNGFSYVHIPETGEHFDGYGKPGKFFLGDVGDGTWEELNFVSEPGQNFGWPDFEGFHTHWPYHYELVYENLDAPNPMPCEPAFFTFQNLISNERKDQEYHFPNPCNENQEVPDYIPTFVHRPPVIAWSNVLWNQPAKTVVKNFEDEVEELRDKTIIGTGISAEVFDGYSSIPGFWYEKGDLADSLQHSLFMADFSGWIKCFLFDEDFQLTEIVPITDQVKGVVSMAYNQKENAIYYVDFDSNQLRRLKYGGNPKPIAIAEVEKNFGPSPLTTSFSGEKSIDPAGEAIQYEWTLDGAVISTQANFEYAVIAESEMAEVKIFYLQVTDESGQISKDSILISLNNTPPVVDILGAEDGDLYPISAVSALQLVAQAHDLEESNEELHYEWQLYVHHNLHFHPEPTVDTQDYLVLLDPIGCGNEDFWYRLRLSVSDNYGLSSSKEIQFFPNCEDPFGEVEWLLEIYRDDGIELKWIKEDVSFEKMELERFDENGNFKRIGIIDYQSGLSAYQQFDSNPIHGRNIYRVKTLKDDVLYDYSSFKTIEFPLGSMVVLFPNPVRDYLYLDSKTFQSGSVETMIFNIKGELIRKYRFNSESWNQGVQIEVDNLPPGTYLIKTYLQEGAFSQLFVVQ